MPRIHERVTVSMPCLRGEAYLRRAVESVLAQTHADLRLIVVNDGGQTPWDVLAGVDDDRLVRFELFRTHGRYFADAVTLQATSDPYFLIHDADDWSEPDRLARLLEARREISADAATASWMVDEGGGQPEATAWVRTFRPTIEEPFTTRFVYRAPHHSLFRTRFLRELGGTYGGFRVAYDSLLMNFVLMAGRLAYVDAPLYHHLLRSDSLAHSEATGIGSPYREQVVRRLRAAYEDVFAYFRLYLRGVIERQDLTRHIRAVVDRLRPPGSTREIGIEANRLSVQLAEARPTRTFSVARASPPRRVVRAARPAAARPGWATISVVIPCWDDDLSTVEQTIESLHDTCARPDHLDAIVVDDCRAKDASSDLARRVRRNGHTSLVRPNDPLGIPAARNLGARAAKGDLLLMTDAQVRFSREWDEVLRAAWRPLRVICGVVTDATTGSARGGLTLRRASMGVSWNIATVVSAPVQVAPAAATAIDTRLFFYLGGYDERLPMFGSSEPEFSVRAWLRGAEVHLEPALVLEHQFATEENLARRAARHALQVLRNRLRFAQLYLSGDEVDLVVAHLRDAVDRDLVDEAFASLQRDEIDARRAWLRSTETMTFDGWVRWWERSGDRDCEVAS